MPDAEAAYRRAVSLTSVKGDVATWLVAQSNLVQLYLAQGRLKDADEATTALAKGAPRAIGTAMLQARLALAEHRLDDAARYAQSVAQGAPNDVQGRMLLAHVVYAQGYVQQAETNLNAVLNDHPDVLPARKMLAELQLIGNRPEVARHTLEPVLSTTMDGETLALAGRIATALGETTEADGYYSRAVDASGASESLRLKVAAQYLAQGNAARATEILGTLPDAGDLAQRRDLLLALATSANQSPETARATIDSVAAKYGDDPGVLRAVATLHAARGDFDAARARLAPWLAVHPDDVATLLALARIDAADKRYDDADRVLRQALAKEPKNIAALSAEAAIALQRNDFDSAVRSLEAARAADRTAVDPRLSLARIYLARDAGHGGGIDQARVPLKEALAAPKRADVLILSAVVEKRSGHDAEAERILKDALTADSSSPPLWLSLGEIQVADNHVADARESFKKALALKPGWLPAVQALAKVEVQADDYSTALGLTAKAQNVTGIAPAAAGQQRAGANLGRGRLRV